MAMSDESNDRTGEYCITVSVDDKGAVSVLNAVRQLGFKTKGYDVPDWVRKIKIAHNEVNLPPAETAAIWLGSRVPANIAVLAIKTVLPIWRHLAFIRLSEDDPILKSIGASLFEDRRHDEIFMGATTKAAKESNCRPWSMNNLCPCAAT